MDFFNPNCQTGPFNQEKFGLCDDQDTTVAYVDTSEPNKWVATVENFAQMNVIFTAIDKCVIQDNEEGGRGRCDGMLTAENLLYLVELKDQKAQWRNHAIEQLKSTIVFLREHHDLSNFRHKKAFACNRRKSGFIVIEQETQRRFFDEYGFRLDLQGIIKINSK
ncbi:hypothetical protein SMM50_003734 [Salmonella enterica]|nr:hypothetical protein [Salmonella enterica]